MDTGLHPFTSMGCDGSKLHAGQDCVCHRAGTCQPGTKKCHRDLILQDDGGRSDARQAASSKADWLDGSLRTAMELSRSALQACNASVKLKGCCHDSLAKHCLEGTCQKMHPFGMQAWPLTISTWKPSRMTSYMRPTKLCKSSALLVKILSGSDQICAGRLDIFQHQKC